jgi:hypothetical protein
MKARTMAVARGEQRVAHEGNGLVRLERGDRGRITPRVMHDRVELYLPLAPSRKAG